jgi:hypothetical protein
MATRYGVVGFKANMFRPSAKQRGVIPFVRSSLYSIPFVRSSLYSIPLLLSSLRPQNTELRHNLFFTSGYIAVTYTILYQF